MPRGDQVARLYMLVRDLSHARHGVTADWLARRRRLPVRTVYRDLHALEAAGFPITTGEGARWKLIDGWQERVPFPLPIGQLLALHVARNLMKPLRGTPAARDFNVLCERLVGPIVEPPRKQGELFPHLRAVLTARSELAIDYSDHTAVLEPLCHACENRVTVRAVYYAETLRELTRREIDPYSLYYDPQLEALYVFAWCHLRRAMRTFAVHRFRQVHLTDQRFQPAAEFTVDNYLGGAFRIWRGEKTVTVRLAIDPAAAGWITERRWHASQRVRRYADGGCEVSFTVDGVQEIRRFMLQLGSVAEVIEPAFLRREIYREQARAARRHRGRPQERLTLDDTGMRETRSVSTRLHASGDDRRKAKSSS